MTFHEVKSKSTRHKSLPPISSYMGKYLASVTRFLICKMRIIIVPTVLGRIHCVNSYYMPRLVPSYHYYFNIIFNNPHEFIISECQSLLVHTILWCKLEKGIFVPQNSLLFIFQNNYPNMMILLEHNNFLSTARKLLKEIC